MYGHLFTYYWFLFHSGLTENLPCQPYTQFGRALTHRHYTAIGDSFIGNTCSQNLRCTDDGHQIPNIIHTSIFKVTLFSHNTVGYNTIYNSFASPGVHSGSDQSRKPPLVEAYTSKKIPSPSTSADHEVGSLKCRRIIPTSILITSSNPNNLVLKLPSIVVH